MQSFGNGNSLQRVAFKLSTGETFNFSINPDSMTENFASRNVFLQPEAGIQMQGFGPGLHTITIQGTTGVRQIAAKSSKGALSYGVDNTAGFEKYHALFNLLKEQLESVHDNATSDDTTLTFGGINLDYYDYTNEHYYHCELSPNGFTFTQSADSPLTYRYEIDLIVIGNASKASTSQTSWLTLGNKVVGLSTSKLKNTPNEFDNKSFDDASKLMASKYTKRNYLTSIEANDYKALRTTAANIERNMKSRGVDGFRSPIINYGDNNSKYYSFGSTLSSKQITALYKKVYSGLTAQVHLVVNDKNVLNINISSDNTSAWNAYWAKYTNTAKGIKNNNGVIDYGQSDSKDSSNKDTNYDTKNIGEILYGNTVPTLDLTKYGDTDTIYKELFSTVLSQYDGQTYTDAAKAFSDGIESTILNYGQLDSGDTAKYITVPDLTSIYNDLYKNTVTNFDYSQYLAMGQLYIAMNGGDMSSFQSNIPDPDATTSTTTANSLPDTDVASDLYSILYGTTLNTDSYNNFMVAAQNYNDVDGLIEDYVGDQSSVKIDDNGNEVALGNVTYSPDNYDSDYENDNYYNRIVDEDDNLADQWTTATQSSANDNSSLYALAGDNTSDTDSLASKVSEDTTSSGSNSYINPNVSLTAPMLGYNEVSNLLRVDESSTA